MQPLLFLVHRIPYPPNKGDKIRSFHLLKYLTKRYQVYLGAFVDDPADWSYVKNLSSICTEVNFTSLNSKSATLKSLKGLVFGQPLTVPYYANQSMQDWVDKVVTVHDIKYVLIFSAAMAQYVLSKRFDQLRRVIDFVDVDSDKWQQYQRKKMWPLSIIYKREAKRLLEYEISVAKKFEASLFVSSAEAELFKKLAPSVAVKVDYFNNGVDAKYFSPALDYKNPFTPEQRVVVFTGAMDYWANVDAVSWFAEEVFPIIRSQVPDAVFYIVGSRPSSQVKRLGKLSGVVVTGTVEDVRPYLKFSRIVVAPLRIARGVQNKVLEAMAMDKLLLATNSAIEGIEPWDGFKCSVFDESEEMAKQAILLLNNPSYNAGKFNSRAWVMEHYSWEINLERVNKLIATH
ncbi:TIGR03087 family PEP-CTERM/XrtA system glycosyltransferase [Beggiatoa alba]|nr:TIGR03087 family PEP-CTERM/XrtA system glycosyltransferase [Beggiatoa alba]